MLHGDAGRGVVGRRLAGGHRVGVAKTQFLGETREHRQRLLARGHLGAVDDPIARGTRLLRRVHVAVDACQHGRTGGEEVGVRLAGEPVAVLDPAQHGNVGRVDRLLPRRIERVAVDDGQYVLAEEGLCRGRGLAGITRCVDHGHVNRMTGDAAMAVHVALPRTYGLALDLSGAGKTRPVLVDDRTELQCRPC